MFKVKVTKRFEKEFRKLDHYTQAMIQKWISKNLLSSENPRIVGKAYKDQFKGLWRYRIGNYRLVCEINDDECVILALNIGHRRDIHNN